MNWKRLSNDLPRFCFQLPLACLLSRLINFMKMPALAFVVAALSTLAASGTENLPQVPFAENARLPGVNQLVVTP